MVQHAAEPLTMHNAAAVGGVAVHWRDELVAQRLVRAFPVIMFDVLANDLPQVTLPERDDACETLAPYRSGPTPCVGIKG